MQDRYLKYFWDIGSPFTRQTDLNRQTVPFILRRILEYASFPDLIKYPFEEVKHYLPQIDLHTLRTGETRKQYLLALAPYIPTADSWEEAIWAMLDDKYFNNGQTVNT